jgi:GntR family transcriptional repressor for pyruvate dehydrogenase complex
MSPQTIQFQKASSPKLAEIIAQQISGWIISQDLKPGQQLPSEQELVTSFDVARSVVREALVRLRALGIIEIRHGKGAYIAAMPLELLTEKIRRLSQDPNELLLEIWEVREILETAIAELAALRCTANDLAKLKAAAMAMDEAIKRGDSAVEEDALFHFHLTQATYNPVLDQVTTGISTFINASRSHSLERYNRPQLSSQEHAGILEAVRRQDPVAARKAMKIHMMNGRKTVEVHAVNKKLPLLDGE